MGGLKFHFCVRDIPKTVTTEFFVTLYYFLLIQILYSHLTPSYCLKRFESIAPLLSYVGHFACSVCCIEQEEKLFPELWLRYFGEHLFTLYSNMFLHNLFWCWYSYVWVGPFRYKTTSVHGGPGAAAGARRVRKNSGAHLMPARERVWHNERVTIYGRRCDGLNHRHPAGGRKKLKRHLIFYVSRHEEADRGIFYTLKTTKCHTAAPAVYFLATGKLLRYQLSCRSGRLIHNGT